ncbi:MAG TPA: acyltransferase [Candidatus Polarisedimenticolia bacterium]|nr:acyltransferase [Candidatus Polarisedimenticolia bacterium]
MGLGREVVDGLGNALLSFLSNWVLFVDGPLVWKVRGRLYSWILGWGRGVGVARFVTFENIRTIRVGEYSRIMRNAVLMGPIEIGSHCWIGEGNMLYPETTLEDGVALGPVVAIVTQWHEIGPPERRAGQLRRRSIRIGRGACINAGAMVLAGCSIGEGAVVAGGSKVTRRVPPHCVVAGNPAVLVRRLDGGS